MYSVAINQPNTVEIGSPNMAFFTVDDNDLGTYIHAISVHEVCLMDYACMYTCIVYSPYTVQCAYIVNVYVIGMHMQLHSSGVGLRCCMCVSLAIAPSG